MDHQIGWAGRSDPSPERRAGRAAGAARWSAGWTRRWNVDRPNGAPMSTPSTPSTPNLPSGPAGAGGPELPSPVPVAPTAPNMPTAPTAPTIPSAPNTTSGHATAWQQPAKPRTALTVPLGQMLYLCVAALGVINLFLGYVDDGGLATLNLYKAGVAIFALAPTMLFLAGLLALRGWLPGERSPGALPAMITTAVFVTLVLSALGSDGGGDLQTLFLVFGGLQCVIAWLAYLFDAGLIADR